MRIAAVGGKETLVGIRLAGVKTVLETSDPEKALAYIRKLLDMEDIAIVIVTRDISDKIQNELETLRKGRATPVFVEFPDMSIFKR